MYKKAFLLLAPRRCWELCRNECPRYWTQQQLRIAIAYLKLFVITLRPNSEVLFGSDCFSVRAYYVGIAKTKLNVSIKDMVLILCYVIGSLSMFLKVIGCVTKSWGARGLMKHFSLCVARDRKSASVPWRVCKLPPSGRMPTLELKGLSCLVHWRRRNAEADRQSMYPLISIKYLIMIHLICKWQVMCLMLLRSVSGFHGFLVNPFMDYLQDGITSTIGYYRSIWSNSYVPPCIGFIIYILVIHEIYWYLLGTYWK